MEIRSLQADFILSEAYTEVVGNYSGQTFPLVRAEGYGLERTKSVKHIQINRIVKPLTKLLAESDENFKEIVEKITTESKYSIEKDSTWQRSSCNTRRFWIKKRRGSTRRLLENPQPYTDSDLEKNSTWQSHGTLGYAEKSVGCSTFRPSRWDRKDSGTDFLSMAGHTRQLPRQDKQLYQYFDCWWETKNRKQNNWR